MTFPVLSANGPSGYNLTNSLRFRASASAYLSRTPASNGNSQIFTWSAWIKRGTLGNQYQNMIGAGSVPGGGGDLFWIQNDTFAFYATGGLDAALVTSQVFRDPSAWYHIVLAVDTTQATAANRVRIYVNGVQITAFSTATYPAQNYNFIYLNKSSVVQYLGLGYLNNFDGYMAEVNFIDGQALTPSSFGSTNAVTGVWQPAKYTGTYGTNGFYLPFTNATSTTTLGNDFSGNGNNWTTNNISLTSGVTYDSMTDVPTLTSATAANYCVLNPLSTASVFSITNGNLTASSSTSTGTQPASFFLTSGKWYWESIGNAYAGAVCGLSGARFTGSISVAGSNGIGYWEGGLVYWDGGNSGAGPASYTSSDVIGVALNMDAGTVAFYKNNSLQFTATFGSGTVPNLSSGCFPCYNQGQSGSTKTANFNFGQRPFAYTPPSGFVALNTFNLPSSTIPAGNKFMDATLYTGTGSSLSVTNSGSMQPDLVWIKSRSAATDHTLYDVLRGTQARLESNTTDAEVTSDNGVTAFGTGGFTVGTLAQVNTSAATYVAWQWKANGAGVTNTAGSITSTVSANTTSGFSVVSFAYPAVASKTVGHGLGVAPSMVILKNRNTPAVAGLWFVYHVSAGATQYLTLESTSAASTNSTVWDNTAPTSSVFTLGSGLNSGNYGTNGIAYCIAQIAGFSAVGSYTGNGSSDGPFIYTGFRPRWVMMKSSSAVGNWIVFDSSRLGYNGANDYLLPNSSLGEGTDVDIDILSNGFKPRDSAGPTNVSGTTYIYAAFAENPFKNALAR